jgi:GNAT superfamily N-acetyltransferase
MRLRLGASGACVRPLNFTVSRHIDMSQPIIRPAQIEDSECIATLISELAVRFIVHEFSPEGRARFMAEHTPASIEERIRAGFSYYVAEVSAEIVGVVGVRDSSHLYHLFVAKAFQGHGLGRKLWEHAKAICLEKGSPGAFTVNASRNAVAVYERLGFVVTAPVQDIGGIQFVPMKLDLAANNRWSGP